MAGRIMETGRDQEGVPGYFAGWFLVGWGLSDKHPANEIR